MDAASKIHTIRTQRQSFFNQIPSFCSELHRNREFYRTHDVRPPFTYVDMIRQVGGKMQTDNYFVLLLSKWHI